MKCFFLLLFWTLFASSCKENNLGQKRQQDSLYTVLHCQITELSCLPKQEKEYFLLKDTLSQQDSALYEDIYSNYKRALDAMDSIQMFLPSIIAEHDTLAKYIEIQDTNVNSRLKYLILLSQNYIKEYYKSMAIIEQNKILLKHFSQQQK